MDHYATVRNSESTINMTAGDTLMVVLPYKETGPEQTYWTFGDNFGHNTSLNITRIAALGGIRIMDFVATSVGTVEIALQQYHALAQQTPSNRTATFKLTVIVR
jgi:predicted GNAT superfamily acetyltransferase